MAKEVRSKDGVVLHGAAAKARAKHLAKERRKKARKKEAKKEARAKPKAKPKKKPAKKPHHEKHAAKKPHHEKHEHHDEKRAESRGKRRGMAGTRAKSIVVMGPQGQPVEIELTPRMMHRMTVRQISKWVQLEILRGTPVPQVQARLEQWAETLQRLYPASDGLHKVGDIVQDQADSLAGNQQAVSEFAGLPASPAPGTTPNVQLPPFQQGIPQSFQGASAPQASNFATLLARSRAGRRTA